LNSFVGGGRRKQRHGAEIVLLAHSQNGACLFDRQVHHDEAVDTRRDTIFA
jgi:hypothetical protein